MFLFLYINLCIFVLLFVNVILVISFLTYVASSRTAASCNFLYNFFGVICVVLNLFII